VLHHSLLSQRTSGNRDRGHPHFGNETDDLFDGVSVSIIDTNGILFLAASKAVAAPIPRLAPVTTVTFSTSSEFETTFLNIALIHGKWKSKYGTGFL